jgi:cytochrome c oxidase cbb3-type subunit 3
MSTENNNKLPEYDEITNDRFLENHEYDGIRELDNDLPTWYRFLFYITILIAVAYLLRYHVYKAAPLQAEEYEIEMAAALGEPLNEEPTEMIAEVSMEELAKDLTAGKKVFDRSCAVCHLSKGEGLVGPNLTDEYWIHGGSFDDIVNVIVEGVPEKGMVSWKAQLSELEIKQVANFILSLQGTNPPNAKAPQGEIYTP